ncbi:hypothetical protein N7466_009349 [Penicillium verhagenii]|uniref:uncharacterized protein n=1 Tax=Penicillium verhagenii TaxID=1562060 RepID=UPI0025455C55|nr:uncharacterized protein N7466_009349 [Penicillium verhagenii]KAJ5921023.1 hypothetical protein N7466_009349 [Penicillium verhagenii]
MAPFTTHELGSISVALRVWIAVSVGKTTGFRGPETDTRQGPNRYGVLSSSEYAPGVYFA